MDHDSFSAHHQAITVANSGVDDRDVSMNAHDEYIGHLAPRQDVG